jgi:type I restriction enzyme S subunit
MSEKVESLKLVDYVTLTKGKPPAVIPYIGVGAEPYLSPEYLRGKTTNAESAKPSIDAVRVQNGDTVLLWDGSNAGEFFIGKSGLLASTMTLIKHGENLDSRYFYYAVKQSESYLKGQTSGSGIPHVDKEILSKLEILNFPIQEQTKIAEILSCIDTAIEQTEAMIAKQQRIKTGLMQDLLSKGIDEHGNIRTEQTHAFKDSELGRIPLEWEVGGFENYVVSNAGIKSGPFGSSITKDMYVEQGYRVYGQEQVIGGTLDIGDYFITARKFKEMEAYSVNSGDVLISLMGTIGHVLIVPKIYHSGVINPRLLRFRPNMKCCLPEFLKALLLSDPVRLQLEKFALGVTMQGLSAGIIKKVSVVLIEIDEQKRIFEVLAKSEKHISSLFESLAKLKRQKTALMQDLLSGNVRVNGLI